MRISDSAKFTTDMADAGHKIYYNSQPVNGTVKRGELFPYTVPNDSNGLLNLSNLVKNPLPHYLKQTAQKQEDYLILIVEFVMVQKVRLMDRWQLKLVV